MLSPRVDFYIKHLSNKNPSIRQKAAKALGQIGDWTCLSRLKAQLEREKDADVRKALRQAIAKLES